MKLVENNLSNIEDIANKTLEKLGETDCAVVSLGKAVFDTRKYDTFSLPAGVYDSLRIRIGKGEGKNVWFFQHFVYLQLLMAFRLLLLPPAFRSR